MRSDPETVVLGLLTAWRLQDVDTVLAYCHDDIRYHVLSPDGERQLGADTVGKADVASYLRAVCGAWEFVDIYTSPVMVEGTRAREQCYYRSVHRRSGLVLEGSRRHVWTIEEGRVRSCTEYLDSGQLEAFLRMAEAACAATVLMAPALAGLAALVAGGA